MKSPIFVCAGFFCLASAFNVNAEAVVLEQKWLTGKTLTYDTNLSGNVNVQIPAEVPFILAGIPLDVEIQGQGKTQLETLKVDEAGTGTVAVKVPEFAMNAQTFGQTAKITLKNGKSSVTLNGKAVNWGKNWGEQTVPKSALKIGKDGKIKGFEPIEVKMVAPAAENAPATTPAKAVNQSALIASMIIQALPALLPANDVKQGERWNSEIKFPMVAKTDAETGEILPVGKFDMFLKGQETVAGKSLWRIEVKGLVEIDGAKVSALGKKAVKADAAQAGPQLESASQTVDGDIWFDAQAGQISNAELVLGSNASTRFPGKAGKLGEPSWLDFTGTLKMKLAENV